MALTQAEREELQGALEYGANTERQRELVRAYIDCDGVYKKAGDLLGCHYSNVRAVVEKARLNAARRGWAPGQDMTHVTPPSHVVKGTSTLYKDDGSIGLQWVKTNLKDEDKFKQITEFAEELAESVKGRAKPTKAPKIDTKDRLALYNVGDPHLGAYAWGEEAGEDFDIEIASSDLLSATGRLVDSAPASEVGVILELGDFFHADNMQGVTARAGNQLDVDTRWPRVMRLGAVAMQGMISLALEKHQKVVVRCNIGNHDDHSSHALGLILEAYYANEPRVFIDTSPNPFWYYRYGAVLIGSTHGHGIKVPDLVGIMAHDKAEDWGKTKHRYWYLGHFHTQRVHEQQGVIIEFARTLAAKDAWTNAMGYRSGRDMTCIVHHKDFGEIERHRADILMVRS